MRILFVCHQFPPETSGGAETHALQLGRALRQLGEEVFVFAAAAHYAGVGERPREESVSGLPVRRVPPAGSTDLIGALSDPRVEQAFSDYVAQVRPEVVHFHHVGRLSTQLVSMAAERGLPRVATLHDFWYLCPRVNLVQINGSLCEGPDEGRECVRAGCLAATWPPAPLAGGGASGRLIRSVVSLLPPGLRARLATAAGRGRRRPAAGTDELARSRRRYEIMQEMLAHFSLVLSPSHFLMDSFLRHRLSPERARYCEYGIDYSRFAGFQRTPRTGALRLGFAGGLHPHKAPHLLVEAAARFAPSEVTVQVWGEGDPQYVAGLRRAAGPNVTLRGRYAAGEIAKAFAQFDVLVVPSMWYENAPCVIDEAFATGTPVIATRLGGMAERVEHEKSGLLFAYGDASALAGCMRRLADEPGLLERLREGIPRVTPVEEVANRIRVWCRAL